MQNKISPLVSYEEILNQILEAAKGLSHQGEWKQAHGLLDSMTDFVWSLAIIGEVDWRAARRYVNAKKYVSRMCAPVKPKMPEWFCYTPYLPLTLPQITAGSAAQRRMKDE